MCLFENFINDIFRIIKEIKEYDFTCINTVSCPQIYVENEALAICLCIKKHFYKFCFENAIKTKENKYIIGALLASPETATMWNLRKAKILDKIISFEEEFNFISLILNFSPRYTEPWKQRLWIFSLIEDITSDMLTNEFIFSLKMATKYSHNYFLWQYLRNLLELHKSILQRNINWNNFLSSLLNLHKTWMETNCSDLSAWKFRIYLLSLLFLSDENADNVIISAEFKWTKDLFEFYGTPSISIYITELEMLAQKKSLLR